MERSNTVASLIRYLKTHKASTEFELVRRVGSSPEEVRGLLKDLLRENIVTSFFDQGFYIYQLAVK